jgi:peroxiredoxin
MWLLRTWLASALICVVVASPIQASDAPAELVLKGIDGKTYKLSDYRGKWVVVNYWASWCPPCLEEIPDLVDFHDAHHDKDAVVWGINTESLPIAKLQTFAESYLVSYPVLQGSSDSADAIGPVPALPTTYLVSPKGEVVARNVGPLTRKQLEDFINSQ